MSNPNKILALRRGTFALAAIAAVLAAGAYVQTIIRFDPFASLKKTGKLVDPSLGARMENVKIESYDKEKLVTKAEMDRMDVRQDKQHYDLFGVHNGVFFSDKGLLNFDSPRAEWNVPGHQMNAPQGAHVEGKNLDLQVSQFAFRSDKGMVDINGAVKGKLNGGNVEARGVKYNVDNGMVKTGPIRWEGKIPSEIQVADQTDPHVWNIESDDFHQVGDIQTYTNGVAFDGDIYVLADVIEHNQKTDLVTATGHVRYFSSKADMVCDKAVIERKVKKATMTGNVQMLLKEKEKQATVSKDEVIPPYRPVVPDEIAKTRPKANQTTQTPEQKKLDDEIRSGKNVHDFPTICYADQIVYWYKKDERHAEITGKPQARQELHDGGWRQVWTHVGYYDGEKDTLKMVSSEGQKDTRMLNSIGDDLTADWVLFSTKEGEDGDWSGKGVKGHVVDYSDEVPRDSKKAPVKQPTEKTGTTSGGTGVGTTGGGTTGGGTTGGGSTGGGKSQKSGG